MRLGKVRLAQVCEVYQFIPSARDNFFAYVVGSALRHNPFAPFVPCHRVIAADLTLGVFLGEWGTAGISNSNCGRKLSILSKEGVRFDATSGKLQDQQKALWRPDDSV